MEIIVVTTHNIAGLSRCGGLKSAVGRSVSSSSNSTRLSRSDNPNVIRPCSVHGESVETYKRGTVVVRYLWNEKDHTPEGWWRPAPTESDSAARCETAQSSLVTVHNSNCEAAATPSTSSFSSCSTLPALELVMGRDSQTCDVVVPLRLEHGPLFSRRHCALRLCLAPHTGETASMNREFGECEMSVVDLGSRNGTFVNGVRIGCAAATPPCMCAPDANTLDGAKGPHGAPQDAPVNQDTASAQARDAAAVPCARFHPLRDPDIATGVSPLLTLSFGTGAAVPVGAELPNDNLRVRFSIYVRVLWRTASWELRQWLSKPTPPRLAPLRLPDRDRDQKKSTEEREEGARTHAPHPSQKTSPRSSVPRESIPPLPLVMHDARGQRHIFVPFSSADNGGCEGGESQHTLDDAPTESAMATQDDWFNAIRHSFEGNPNELTRTTVAVAARSSSTGDAGDLHETASRAMCSDAGLQWWVYQLGGCVPEQCMHQQVSRERTAPVEVTSASLTPPHQRQPMATNDTADRLRDTRVLKLASFNAGMDARTSAPRGSASRGGVAAAESAVRPRLGDQGERGQVSAHVLARAVVAQHAAIGEDGFVRAPAATSYMLPEPVERERISASPSPSPSPARQTRASTSLPSAVASQTRFSHILAVPHAHDDVSDLTNVENALAPTLPTASSLPRMASEASDDVDFDDDAPVLVRSRRASRKNEPAGSTPGRLVATVDDESDSFAASPPPVEAALASTLPPVPSSPPSHSTSLDNVRLHNSTERLSSKPPVRRSVSLSVWHTPNTKHTLTNTTPGRDTEQTVDYDEDYVIDVAVTPPPEPVHAYVESHAEEIARQDDGATPGGARAGKSEKRSKPTLKRARATNAEDTIRRFVMELQTEGSTEQQQQQHDGEIHKTSRSTPLSPLFNMAPVDAGEGRDVLSQLQQEVAHDTGMHAHVSRGEARRRHGSGAVSDTTAATSVAKRLAATLRAGLALGSAATRETSKTDESEMAEDDELALADVLSLTPFSSTKAVPALTGALSVDNAQEAAQPDGRRTAQLDRAFGADDDDEADEDDIGDTKVSRAPKPSLADLDEALFGRPTSSTTHLSPRTSFGGAHLRATAAPPDRISKLESPNTWCVFVSSGSPCLSQTRSSRGVVLGDEEAGDGGVTSERRTRGSDDGAVVQRLTLQDVLSQHLLDESFCEDCLMRSHGSEQGAVSRRATSPAGSGRNSHGATGACSQYSVERAWILTGTGGEAHGWTPRSSALFQPKATSLPSSQTAHVNATTTAASQARRTRRSATQSSQPAVPPLSQLMSLDVQAYLFSDRKDAKGKRVMQKRGDTARPSDAVPPSSSSFLRHAAPFLVVSGDDKLPAPFAQPSSSTPLLIAPSRATARAAVTPARDAAQVDENLLNTFSGAQEDGVAGLPLAVAKALYPSQKAALRFLWRVLLTPSHPLSDTVTASASLSATSATTTTTSATPTGAIASSSSPSPLSLSTMLTTWQQRRDAMAVVPSSPWPSLGLSDARLGSSKGLANSKRAYRPLITVSDIADILDAHQPSPRLALPPPSPSASSCATADVTSSQMFGHRHLEHRASQLSTATSSLSRTGAAESAPEKGRKRPRPDDSDRVLSTDGDVALVAADSLAPRGAVLAHAAGLGKTVTTVAFLVQLGAATSEAAQSTTAGAWQALPLVFRAPELGGRGGVRPVLCVPKQVLMQWTRTLDTWLTFAGQASRRLFVLHQEGRRCSKARQAVLEEWASSPCEYAPLLVLTHTVLISLLASARAPTQSACAPCEAEAQHRETRRRTETRKVKTSRSRRAEKKDEDEKKEEESAPDARKGRRRADARRPSRRAPKRSPPAKSTLAATHASPPLESFWVDELSSPSTSASSKTSRTPSRSASAESCSTTSSRSSLSAPARHTKRRAPMDETLLGGELEAPLSSANAHPLPSRAPAAPQNSTEDALAGSAASHDRASSQILLRHTTLLILDEAERLTDTTTRTAKSSRTREVGARSGVTVEASATLSWAVAQFPPATVRVALTGRLPSTLPLRRGRGEVVLAPAARASLCGLLRFVRPDVQSMPSAQLVARYYEAEPGVSRITLQQRAAWSCCEEEVKAKQELSETEDVKRNEHVQSITDRLASLTRASAPVPLAAAARPSSSSWYSLSALRGSRWVGELPDASLPTTATLTEAGTFAVEECTPGELDDACRPRLVETTLVFDLSPVQAVLLRELVQDIATPAVALPTHTESADTEAAVRGGDVQKTTSPPRNARTTARRGPAKTPRPPSSSSPPTKVSVEAPSTSTWLVVPTRYHMAFTTYALYISNQCDLVRDWTQRQGIDVHASVHDVEVHEAACAADPTRRVRWAIPSLLIPSVFDAEENSSATDTPHASLMDAEALTEGDGTPLHGKQKRASRGKTAMTFTANTSCSSSDPASHSTSPVCMEALGYSWKMRGLFFLLRTALARGEKVIVFSHSLKTLVLMAWLLDRGNAFADGVDFALISGALSLSQRDALYGTFNDRSSPLAVLLMTFEVVHTGIDLPGADRVVLYDISRSTDTEVQAVTRAYRLCGPAPTSTVNSTTPSQRHRTIYVNRLLSNEPVEIQSLPMSTLQSLAVSVLTADTAKPTQRNPRRSEKVKGEAAAAHEDMPVRQFVEDIARLDVKTGFSTSFAAVVALRAGLSLDDDTEEGDAPSSLHASLATLNSAGAAGGRATVGSPRASHHPRGSTTPIRTIARALNTTSMRMTVGLSDSSRGAPHKSPPPPAPPAPPPPTASSSPAVANRQRRRCRSATPPPPPLPSRRQTGLEPVLVVAQLEAYFARRAAMAADASRTLIASLPTLSRCLGRCESSGEGDGTPHRISRATLSAASTQPARYAVRAVTAYLQLAEERRRQRCQRSCAAGPCEVGSSSVPCVTCEDPVVAELACMEAVRDIFALHFHESRIWNAVNGAM